MASQTQNAGTVADDSSTGGAVSWANPTKAQGAPDDTNGANSASGTAVGSAVSHSLRASNFGFSIPEDATILGIVITIYKACTGGSGVVSDSAINAVKSDGSNSTTNASVAANWGIIGAVGIRTDTYGSSTSLWGETWTPADINDSDFGARLKASFSAAGGPCFPAGTLIATPSGQRMIETIRAGDEIISFDPDTRAIRTCRVSQTYKFDTAELISIRTIDRIVDATPDHRFLTPNGFVEARELRIGDTLFEFESDILVPRPILGIYRVQCSVPVFDLTVEETHTFIANGFAVHNAGQTGYVDAFAITVYYSEGGGGGANEEYIVQFD